MYTVFLSYGGYNCCSGRCDCFDTERKFKFNNFRRAKKFFIDASYFAKNGGIYYKKIDNFVMEFDQFTDGFSIFKKGKWNKFKPTHKPH